jgi:hypothetical protein
MSFDCLLLQLVKAIDRTYRSAEYALLYGFGPPHAIVEETIEGNLLRFEMWKIPNHAPSKWKQSDPKRTPKQVAIVCKVNDKEFGIIYAAWANPRLKQPLPWRRAMREKGGLAMQTGRAIIFHRRMPRDDIQLQLAIAIAQLVEGLPLSNELRNLAASWITQYIRHHYCLKECRKAKSFEESNGLDDSAARMTTALVLKNWIYPESYKAIPKYISSVCRPRCMELIAAKPPFEVPLKEDRLYSPAGRFHQSVYQPVGNKLTVSQAADLLGCTRKALYGYVRRGLIRPCGKNPLVFNLQSVEDLAKYLHEREERKKRVWELEDSQNLNEVAARMRVLREKGPLRRYRKQLTSRKKTSSE